MSGKICVTGATGYLARHVVAQALQAGYSVMGTARTAERLYQLENEIRDIRFRPHNAELTASWGWQAAMADCKAVIHCASPFPLGEPKHPDDVIETAVKGVRQVLTAAMKSGVKRVVMTSSCVAIGSGHLEDNLYLTADDWSDLSAEVSSYTHAKTLAEKEAWTIAEENPELELVVINPNLILGPRLTKNPATSVKLVQMMLAGKFPMIPKVSFAPVDVRDVASAHINALTGKRSVGKRFILAGESIWMSELAKHFKAYSRKVSSREMPNWLSTALAVVDPNLKAIRSELDLMRYFDTQPARKTLKFSPRPLEETIRDMVESIQDS